MGKVQYSTTKGHIFPTLTNLKDLLTIFFPAGLLFTALLQMALKKF